MSTQKWLLGFLIKADIWGKSEAAVKKNHFRPEMGRIQGAFTRKISWLEG